MKLLRKHPVAWLFGLCYGTALLALLAVHLAGFVQNRLLYANGTFATAQLTLADFTLQNDLVLQNGKLVSTGADPQLWLNNPQQKVDTVYIEVQYSLEPRMQTAFYAQPGQQHSIRRAVYAQAKGQGAEFWLPAFGGQTLRLDLTTVPYNVMSVGQIVINQPRPFYAFFLFSSSEWLAFAVLPALAACLLSILRQGLGALRGKKTKGETV
ncbi:MAG: hypothetical protein ACK5L3_11590 [Oscillospiraceae bacterium]